MLMLDNLDCNQESFLASRSSNKHQDLTVSRGLEGDSFVLFYCMLSYKVIQVLTQVTSRTQKGMDYRWRI